MNTALAKDLKNGMSLEEALIKHNTNLQKELGRTYKRKPKKQSTDPNAHVYRCYAKWAIKKTINKKPLYYGIYDTVYEARLVRDELIKCGWDKNELKHILKRLNIKPAIPKKGSEMKYIYPTLHNTFQVSKRIGSYPKQIRIYCGTFATLEDAKIIRDEMMECDWDITQLEDIKEKYNIKTTSGE